MNSLSGRYISCYRQIAYRVSHHQLAPGSTLEKWSFTVIIHGDELFVPKELFVSFRWFDSVEEAVGAGELWARQYIDAALAVR
ncbi:hypothetical protein [Stutzerimonas stutzeri]|uniref:hypothetical protein n=1 Tax=Stutzerimonas stutzeri TaxID=316 RepID=UPI001C84EC34|nr:hypothetical protein [Stutzerimonas stutzeri]